MVTLHAYRNKTADKIVFYMERRDEELGESYEYLGTITMVPKL